MIASAPLTGAIVVCDPNGPQPNPAEYIEIPREFFDIIDGRVAVDMQGFVAAWLAEAA
jgi:hypothetical protein